MFEKTGRALAWITAATAAVLASVQGTIEARQLTLEQAVELALANSHEIKAARLEVEKARYQKLSALSQMGPKLGLGGKLLRWDEPTEVDMGFEIPPELKKTLGFDVPSSLKVMDQTTGELTLTVAQPLTPLYSIVSLYKVQGLNELAARAKVQAKAQEVRYMVADAYFGILKLKRARKTVRMAIEQVRAHLKTAKAFYEQGYVQKDDVLRAEVALAEAKDRLRQVDTALEVSKSALNMLLGLPLQETIELVDDYPDLPPALEITMEEAVQTALRKRPEIAEIQARLEMAKAARDAAMGAMLPTMSAVFNLSRQWGNDFQRRTSYFVGGILEWNFWEWGTQYFQVKAAERDIARAEEALRAVRDAIALDVKKTYLQAKLARDSIVSAHKSVEQAKESLRIARRKYGEKVATSMEVLDAESALTQARNSYNDALYSFYRAIQDLKRAMGKQEVER